MNIGAFPLRPKDEHNRQLLEEFIWKLICEPSSTTISEVIPQKGTIVDVADRVLIGIVKPSPAKDYNKNFEEGCATLYYTGSKFPTTIALHNLHYFIPYFEGRGIRDVYEITHIRTIKGSEAKELEGVDEVADDIRLAFHLHFNKKLSDGFLKIDTGRMINYAFIDTTFATLSNYMKS